MRRPVEDFIKKGRRKGYKKEGAMSGAAARTGNLYKKDKKN